MDIQLFATDKELKEFPEDKTDPDITSSPNSIHIFTSDLPRPHTVLPKSPSSLPVSITKTRCRCKTKRNYRCKSKSNSKDPIVNCSVIQVNDCLPPIQKKQSIIQMGDTAYLLDRSFSWSLGQPIVSQPGIDQSSADQPGGPILPLLSLQLQPDLNALARTLSSQALQYIHIGIQIGRTLLN